MKKEMSAKERIIIPLDVGSMAQAEVLVKLLKNDVKAFKIGLELLNRAGFNAFPIVREAGGKKIFYDAKFHDIPNTVAGAMYGAVKRTLPWMINVHCGGGLDMMKAARKSADEASEELGGDFEKTLVIGVTLLTSLDYEALCKIEPYDQIDWERRFHQALIDTNKPGGKTTWTKEEIYKWSQSALIREIVIKRALTAKEAGLDGVVASPREIEAIREACGDDFVIVTPGVRPLGTDAQDQKRVMTPEEAVRLGADYLVIGRPIIKSDNPVEATRAIVEKIEEVAHG